MNKEIWKICKVELPIGINKSTVISTIFQCFGEDDHKLYDAEGSGYYKELCSDYK